MLWNFADNHDCERIRILQSRTDHSAVATRIVFPSWLLDTRSGESFSCQVEYTRINIIIIIIISEHQSATLTLWLLCLWSWEGSCMPTLLLTFLSKVNINWEWVFVRTTWLGKEWEGGNCCLLALIGFIVIFSLQSRRVLPASLVRIPMGRAGRRTGGQAGWLETTSWGLALLRSARDLNLTSCGQRKGEHSQFYDGHEMYNIHWR